MSFSADWTQSGYNPEEHGFWKADTGESNFGYPDNYFFADTMRAVSIAFGNKFANIYVIREDEKGYPRKRIQVPIKFGPRAKTHDYRTELENATIDENGVVDPKYYIQNPNMTWKFTNVQYDNTRQTSSDTIRTFYDKYLLSKGVELQTCDLLWQDTMPIPVNLGIQLTAYCDKDSDAQRILEQVITTTKDSVLYLHVKEFWFMNIRRDIKVKLDGCEFSVDSDDMNEDAKREIKVVFNFTCEAVLYHPITKGDLITSIVTTLNANVNGENAVKYGLSGNMYTHEKYVNSANYAEAVANKYFDGSLTSAYDYTKNGRVCMGLASAMVSSYTVELTNEELAKYNEMYGSSADNIVGYSEHYVYSAIPDSWREYDRTYKLLDKTTYVFGDVDSIEIINGNAEHCVTSGTCLTFENKYVYPYTGFERNYYTYGNKEFEDSKQNIINTVYAQSHTH